MPIILDPPILAVIYGNSTEISRISREISKFQRRFQDFNDFTDFTKDLRISTEISGFHERFQISREISGEVYEISVSGGPLGKMCCPRRDRVYVIAHAHTDNAHPRVVHVHVHANSVVQSLLA